MSSSGAPTTQSTFQLLRDISEAANSSLILDEIFEALGDVLQGYFPYREATIAVFDETLNGIKLMVRMLENGLLDFRSEHNRFTGDDPLIRQILYQPRALWLSGEDLDAVKQSVTLSPWATHALLVPLVNKGVLIGVLVMMTDRDDTLTKTHLDTLEQVIQPVSVAMENAKLYWQTQMQAGREFLINQITKSIRQSLQVDGILTTATDTLGRTTGVSRCIIQTFAPPLTPPDATKTPDPNDTDANLYMYAAAGTSAFNQQVIDDWQLERKVFEQRLKTAPPLSPISSRWDGGLHLNPFVLNDIQDCPDTLITTAQLTEKSIQSLAIFPICVENACVGAITLHQCDQVRVWLEEDIGLFSAIAEHLGLALYQARLYTSVETQNQRLQTTLDELQQAQLQLIQSEKMAVIGQFVAGIAHEVNTPLGAITSNQQTLQQCVDTIQTTNGQASEKVLSTMGKLLEVNHLAATRIDEIVRNLRNFARLDESDLKPIDLRDSLKSTRLLLDRALKDARITLTDSVADDTPLVTCFPGLLNQVLMNVLVNAIHALEKTDNATIHVAVSLDNPNTVAIRVTDNGPGIPADIKEKVFDPGFTTKGVGVGTGLGLALCYRIMAKHQGLIQVENTGPTGTTMCLTLPVKPTLS